jgi:ATP-dependent DNA helicase PIF1
MEDLDIEEEAINYWRKQEEKAGRANTKKRQRTDSTDLGSDNLPLKSEKPLPPDASTPQDSQANPFVLDTSPSPKPPPKRLAQGYDASTSGYDTHRFDDYAYQQPVTDASTRPDDIAEIEPTLCKEQADLVDLIMSGRNVFYTGSAGCGKSTVLKAFVKRLTAQGKTVQILAPTGRAALAINGTTTWSYLGWVPSHHKLKLEDLLRKADGKLTWKRLNATDVIVIDEISMVENLHFERMNIFLQKARGNRLPFGGVQMVVTGDFCQLPPVKPFQHCIHCGEDLIEHKREKEYECLVHGFYYDRDKWAFRSNAWKLCEFVHVNLKTIHRQSDKVFIDLLQKIRLGLKLSSADMDLLLNHETKGMNANAVKLFGSRAEVDRVNAERFRKLRSKPRSYMCLDDFRWNERHYNLRDKGQRAPNGALIELVSPPRSVKF